MMGDGDCNNDEKKYVSVMTTMKSNVLEMDGNFEDDKDE